MYMYIRKKLYYSMELNYRNRLICRNFDLI